jgi:hypothetical protein
MSDSRFWVRRYLAEGWSVIPIPRGEKGPRVPGWQNTAFTEEDFGADDNIGVRLGEPSGHLIDIDLDAPEAVAAARVLLIQSQRVSGHEVKPASHYWFICPGLKSTRYTAPDGSVLVEIRSTGGQTVLPPSLHPGGFPYQWEQERDPMKVEAGALVQSVKLVATAALVGRFWPKGARHEAAGALAGFLAVSKVDPTAIERLVKVAAELAKDEEASDRARFAGDTARKAQASPDNPHTGATRLAELIGDEPVKRLRSWFGVRSDSAVDELNATYFQVRVGSEELIGHEDDDRVIFQTPAACRVRFANQLVVAGEKKNGDDVLRSKFDVWYTAARRRGYRAIAFAPPGYDPAVVAHYDPARDFNLWRGFRVQPDPGPQPETRCARYLAHTRDVICAGNPEIYGYVLDWMANLVQHPGRQGETAIALKGQMGAGKGMWVRWLLKLFGEHGIQIDKATHLTGKFNAQLSAKILVFGDEAIWAGNMQERGALKRLITEPTLTIERKGIDPVDEPNFIHLITATNEDWSVPAELRERRWLPLLVSDSVAQDHGYFEKLKDEQDNGGLPALLAFLLQRTITRNLRRVPKTAEMIEQQDLTKDRFERFVLDALWRGTAITPRSRVLNGHKGCHAWSVFLSTDDWFADYRETTRDDRLSLKQFSMRVSKLLPAEWRGREQGRDGARGYHLGSLDAARRFYDRATLGPEQRHDWPAEDDGLPFAQLDPVSQHRRSEAAAVHVFALPEPLEPGQTFEITPLGRQESGRPVYLVRALDSEPEEGAR